MSHNLFSSLYNKGAPFALIDTRERRDHVNGHWFGSTNIPLSVLPNQIKRFVPDPDFPIHLLDWQDATSAAAADQLLELGYSNVEQHPTSKPAEFGHGFVKGEFVWSKAFGEVLAHTCGIPEITPTDYQTQYLDAHLFDVRPTAEYAQFTIPGSQSLPNSLLLANMEALQESGKCALLHCAGRTRSIIGACTLKAAGYQGPFVIFKGGTQAWQLDGLEREFNANRVFAKESDNAMPVKQFLDTWKIEYAQVNNAHLESFVAGHKDQLLFDVSDDAAKGQLANHGIVKISGTNLIQQTDRSIARYHVPITLFDHGSGSRAAFAAYWLQLMGFSVSVVYLDVPLGGIEGEEQPNEMTNTPYSALTLDQLFEHHRNGLDVFDFRSSLAYTQGHLKDCEWRNISEVLNSDMTEQEPIALVAEDISQAHQIASLLEKAGWNITGFYCWEPEEINPKNISTDRLDSPIDQSALFAGRHHGNMQDSRDYLAWEEALPENIDTLLYEQWLAVLK